MMTPKRMEQSLWAMTVLMAITSALVMRSERPSLAGVEVRLRAPAARLSARVPSGAEDTADRVRQIVSGDLFRRERQAPDSAPTPLPAQMPMRPPSPPKPRLVLQGLIGGPPWDAIVQGFPGHEEGFVVRAGDAVGGLKIRSVRRDGATIGGMDTTWILKLGRTP